MEKDRIIYLYQRYINQTLSSPELEEFNALLADKDLLPLHELIDADWDALKNDELLPVSDERKEAVFQYVTSQAQQLPERHQRLWPRYAAAAVLLVGLSLSYLAYRNHNAPNALADTEQIAPVQQGVVLMLAKGQQIRLDRKHNGQIASENGAQISQHDSSVAYQATGGPASGNNTVSNNGSEKFSITLADGSTAILDIGSSLTYPVAFSGRLREVRMSGQAYFKVKHQNGIRFIVRYQNQSTEDIGTEFNIAAYADEPSTKTTLVAGAVKVSLAGAPAVQLKPGEQAVAAAGGLKVAEVNLEDATSWLQGQLVFHNETLENILRHVARIYNVSIVWEDQEVRKLTFGGAVTRKEKLATVLNYFRKAGGVDFKVEGKTVHVFKPKRKN